MRSLALAALTSLLAAGPSGAFVTEDEDCFSVTGVAPGGSLEVRTRPAADAFVIGFIPGSATRAVTAEKDTCGKPYGPEPRGDWCRVTYRVPSSEDQVAQVTGWVPKSTLRAEPECPRP